MPSDLSEGICVPRVPLAVAAVTPAAVRIVSTLSELATPGADVAMHSLDQMQVSA